MIARDWVETASSIKTFLTCQTKYTYAYLRLRRPRVVARPMVVGSGFHSLVEAYWRGKQAGAPPVASLGAAVGAVRANKALSAYDQELVVRLGIGYASAWELAPDGRPVTVEHAFEVEARAVAPLAPPGVAMAGKIDLVLADASGYHTVVEHKTAGGEKPGYFERLRIDTQLAVYDAVARQQFQPYAGLLYDVVVKPAIRPLEATPEESRKFKKGTGELYAGQRLTDESPAEYGARVWAKLQARPAEHFKRYRLARTGDAVTQTKHDLAAALRQIGHVRLTRPTRNPGACFDHGSPCPYFDVCTGLTTIDDDARFRDAIPHEELAAPEAAAEPHADPE